MTDDEITERVGAMLKSFYESYRFAAPEMFLIHLENLGHSINALALETRDRGYDG